MQRRFMHVLLVLTLVFSSVSPACAFISGQNTSVIEICTALGTKSIVVDANGQPVQSDHQKQVKKSDCAFCFAQSHGKTLAASILMAFSATVIRENPDLGFRVPDVRIPAHIYTARAPPAFPITL